MSLTGTWIDMIYRVATGDWKIRLLIAPVAAVSFLSFILLLVMVSVILDRFLQFPYAVYYPWSMVFGLCIMGSGFFLMSLSVFYFIKAKGTPVPFSPPPKLVSTGPYRFVRNPMLTGLFILLFGVGIFIGSLSLFFIFTPLFIFINLWELRYIEEPELEKRLGPEYIAYKKQVPMFFPFSGKK